VERKWRKFKYSVNSETSLRENENKANNNVKNEHLATHNNKGENKKNANTRISVLQHRYKRSTEPQLTATKTDYNNSNNKEASKITAKHGKSIIPARSKCTTNCQYGSFRNTDSPKELGLLDNIFKNTKSRTRTRIYVKIECNFINPILNPISNPITNPTLTRNHHEPKPKASYKQNPTKNEGQGHGRDKININIQAQKMAPKIMRIHIRNTLVLHQLNWRQKRFRSIP